MAASRKHGLFNTRWPCAREHRPCAAATAPPLPAAETAEVHERGGERRTAPALLSLVPMEPVPTPVEREPDEEATRRLLAAMVERAAKRSQPLEPVTRGNTGGSHG